MDFSRANYGYYHRCLYYRTKISVSKDVAGRRQKFFIREGVITRTDIDRLKSKLGIFIQGIRERFHEIAIQVINNIILKHENV